MTNIARNQAYSIGLSLLSQGIFPNTEECDALFQGNMPESLQHIFMGSFQWEDANSFLFHLQSEKSFANAGFIPRIIEHIVEHYKESLTLESLNRLNIFYREYILNHRLDLWVPLLEQSNNDTFYEHYRLYEDVLFDATTFATLESQYPHIFYDFYRIQGLSEDCIGRWTRHAHIHKLLQHLPASYLTHMSLDEITAIPIRQDTDAVFLHVISKYLYIKREHDLARFMHLMKPSHESPIAWAHTILTRKPQQDLFSFFYQYWSTQPDSYAKNTFLGLAGLSELYELQVFKEYKKQIPNIVEQDMLYLS